MDIKISFVRKRSAKQIVLAWFKLSPKLTAEQIKHKIVPLDAFTKKSSGSLSRAIKEVRRKKAWGFCRHLKGQHEITFWIHKDVSIQKIAHLLAHEIAHAAGNKSEDTANKYGAITSFTLDLILKFFKQRLIKDINS